MNLGTKIYTLLFGNLVGQDQFGNKYYCNSNKFESKSAKRWVIFYKEIEASKVPPHWHAWLHKTINVSPINYSHKYSWQKEHSENFTGTSNAYFPNSHPLSKSLDNIKSKKEYERWKT